MDVVVYGLALLGVLALLGLVGMMFQPEEDE